MAEALVKKELLRWARERADLSIDALAEKVGTRPARLESWETGEKRPTFKQAQRLANVTHVPFGYLFLDSPPDDDINLPDLRTVGGEPPQPFNAESKDLIEDILFKHDWFKEYLLDQGAEALPFVGRFALDASPSAIAQDIRRTLRLEAVAEQSGNWTEYLRRLLSQAESAGIWMMRSGTVGSNTHRPLLVEQFRGFAIADSIAPLVFINGKDATAAQIFTFAHEVGHIWLGQSGVSNVPISRTHFREAPQVEVVCNAVAAEVLVPSNIFRRVWNRSRSVEENVNALSALFKVSRIVIARRSLDHGFITQRVYDAFFAGEKARWQEEADEGASGGDFYRTLPIKMGRRFTNAVVSSAVRGDLLLRDAARLLNTKPATVLKFFKQSGET
jgi:Zn-dependent peptidase ImmA (M78 family)/transcriptional regulator with XRE-family HTH domain